MPLLEHVLGTEELIQTRRVATVVAPNPTPTVYENESARVSDVHHTLLVLRPITEQEPKALEHKRADLPDSGCSTPRPIPLP